MNDYRERADVAAKRTPSTWPSHHSGRGRDRRLDVASGLGNASAGRVLMSAGIQRAGATSAQHLDESVARAIQGRRGGGRPLAEGVRADMEESLGHDFSDVRIHSDSDAHNLNEAVSARAFTTGNDVFFKQGTYNPASSAGRELLAHELTHVVQQRTGTSGLAHGEVSHPSDAAERHAAEAGRLAATQPAVQHAHASAAIAGVARDAAVENDQEELMMSRALDESEDLEQAE